MMPFAFGLLRGRLRDLKLIGVTVRGDVIQPQTASATLRFDGDGDAKRQSDSGPYVAITTDSWMHDDFAPFVDSNLYECGVFGVTGNGLSTFGVGDPAVDQYHTIGVGKEWTLTHTGPVQREVTGEYRVREIANPSNEATANFTLQAIAEINA